MSETEESTAPHIIPAGEAAKELGVSASGLRRLLVIYEEVHGLLPRKGVKETDPRIISPEVVERLATSRKLVEAERFKSIAEALQALEDGFQPDINVENTLDTVTRGVSDEALGVLLREVQAMRAELAELRPVRGEVQALRDEITTLKALPAPEPEQPEGETTTGPERDADHGLLVRLALWVERRFRN